MCEPIETDIRTVDSKNAESVIKVGKNIIHVKSSFVGKKSYVDIMSRIIENKLNRLSFE